MIVKETNVRYAEDWEDIEYFVSKEIKADGGCIVQVTYAEKGVGYVLKFLHDVSTVDERI